jgi:signal transduction histidine kinase
MTFKKTLISGLAAAFALLLLVAVASYASLLRNASDLRWVTHTHLVLEKLDALQIHLVDAETGQRGYIITGDESYLKPYQDGLGGTRQTLQKLRELTADNPAQQGSLDRLEPLVAVKLGLLQSRIDVRKNEGLAAGAAAVAGGTGKQIMDEVRALVATMKQEEDRLLVKRSHELEASSLATKIIIIAGETFAILLLLAAGLVIWQEMARRQVAEGEVRSLNVDLERRIAERTAQLAERAKDLERSNRELQQFAYVASHDLQEPLRTISSFTQLLAKRYQDNLDDKAREFINFAVDGCKRMQNLINDLLSFSRVGTQGKPLERVSCDVVLDRALTSLKIAVQESRAVVSRDPLPFVLADPVQLGQLFQNLLGNAVKFRGKDTPRIHISAEPQGAHWRISIRDNGIGIAPEHNDRIFVIFQRLHTKAQYPGTGIGLAICKKIAERHGGRIWVSPAPGGGSIFSFTLPDATSQSHTLEEGQLHELRTSTAAN